MRTTPAMPTTWRFPAVAEFERMVRRFSLHVCATVMEEGFAVHHRKTRIMRHGARQHLAGLCRQSAIERAENRLRSAESDSYELHPARR